MSVETHDLPPDLTVPIADPGARRAEWSAADEQGSAEAAYALAVLHFQSGEHDQALAALQRADRRGSAEAAYMLGADLATRGEMEQMREAFERADTAGSVFAPLVLGQLAEQGGDDDAAAIARSRARRRAETADGRGSADAACFLGQLLLAEDDPAGAEAAWERADERGSGMGAYLHSQMLYERGEKRGAEAAAARAFSRGMAAGGYALGVLLRERGRHARARHAWRTAQRLAAAQGDTVTHAAADAALHPPAREWARTHAIFIGTVLLGGAGLIATGNWAWAAAGAAWLAAVAAWRRRMDEGTPLNSVDTSPQGDAAAVSAGNLSVFGGTGSWPTPFDDREPATRPSDARDRSYWRFFVATLAALAAGVTLSAAGVLEPDLIPRLGLGWAAVVLLWATAWVFPHTARRSAGAAPATSDTGDSVRFGGAFSPIPFTHIFFRASISHPLLAPVVDALRSRRREDRVGAGIGRVVAFAPNVIAAAFLGALAVAPDQGSVAVDGLEIGLGALELVAVGAGVALCLYGVARSLRYPDATTLLTSVVYLLAAAGVVWLASMLGLLDPWVSIWDTVSDLA